jgi:hypothetical protein
VKRLTQHVRLGPSGADATRQQPGAATTDGGLSTNLLDRPRNQTGVLRALPGFHVGLISLCPRSGPLCNIRAQVGRLFYSACSLRDRLVRGDRGRVATSAARESCRSTPYQRWFSLALPRRVVQTLASSLTFNWPFAPAPAGHGFAGRGWREQQPRGAPCRVGRRL